MPPHVRLSEARIEKELVGAEAAAIPAPITLRAL